LSLTDRNIWQVDENQRIYRDENGKRIYYDVDSEESMRLLRTNFKCYSSGAKIDGDKCDDYIHKCLLSTDNEGLKKCASFWRGDFFSLASNSIRDTHPLILVRTLQRFSFRTKHVYDDEYKTKIKKFEDVDNWISNVLYKEWGKQDDGSGNTLRSILEDNDNIISYLRLVVEFVNNNPAIINGKELAVRQATSKARTARTKYAEDLNIPYAIDPVTIGDRSTHDFGMLKNFVDNGYNGRSRNRQSLSQSGVYGAMFQSPFANASYGLSPYQYGGAGEESFYAGNLAAAPEALKSFILNLIAELKDAGKEICDEDVAKIKQKIDNLVTISKELIKIHQYLEEYHNLIDIFRDDKSELLTMDMVNKLVNKHKGLQDRKYGEEDVLMKILGALQGLKCNDSDEYKELVEEVPCN